MSEEEKAEAPKAETPKVEAAPAQSEEKKHEVKDSARDRTICTVLLVIIVCLFVHAISTLVYHKSLDKDPDAEGLYMFGIMVDHFFICICNAVVTGKSLGRLKWVFYKVTMVLALIIWIASIVLALSSFIKV